MPVPHYVDEMLKHSLISAVRPAVHKNPSRKRSFSKMVASRFRVDGKDSKMAGDCFVFKFLQRSVDGKHLMRLYPWLSELKLCFRITLT